MSSTLDEGMYRQLQLLWGKWANVRLFQVVYGLFGFDFDLFST